MCDCILIDGLWQTVWLDGQGLRRNVVRKVVTMKSGEEG